MNWGATEVETWKAMLRQAEGDITALRAEVERWTADHANSRWLNKQLHAEIAALHSQLSARDAEVRALRGAVQNAYGFLWCVNSELGTPHQYSAERAAYEARKVLRDLLTHEQIGAGINSAIAVVRATPLLTGAAAGEGEG